MPRDIRKITFSRPLFYCILSPKANILLTLCVCFGVGHAIRILYLSVSPWPVAARHLHCWFNLWQERGGPLAGPAVAGWLNVDSGCIGSARSPQPYAAATYRNWEVILSSCCLLGNRSWGWMRGVEELVVHSNLLGGAIHRWGRWAELALQCLWSVQSISLKLPLLFKGWRTRSYRITAALLPFSEKVQRLSQ